MHRRTCWTLVATLAALAAASLYVPAVRGLQMAEPFDAAAIEAMVSQIREEWAIDPALAAAGEADIARRVRLARGEWVPQQDAWPPRWAPVWKLGNVIVVRTESAHASSGWTEQRTVDRVNWPPLLAEYVALLFIGGGAFAISALRARRRAVLA